MVDNSEEVERLRAENDQLHAEVARLRDDLAACLAAHVIAEQQEQEAIVIDLVGITDSGVRARAEVYAVLARDDGKSPADRRWCEQIAEGCRSVLHYRQITARGWDRRITAAVNDAVNGEQQ